MCAHQKFEAKYQYGARVKYTLPGAGGVIPDGRSSNGSELKELKPNAADARRAANRTARITGVRTRAYYWVHNGGTSFTFHEVTMPSNAPQARAVFITGPRRGWAFPMLRNGAASGWNYKSDDELPEWAYEEYNGPDDPESADWGEDGLTDLERVEIETPVLVPDDELSGNPECDYFGPYPSLLNPPRWWPKGTVGTDPPPGT